MSAYFKLGMFLTVGVDFTFSIFLHPPITSCTLQTRKLTLEKCAQASWGIPTKRHTFHAFPGNPMEIIYDTQGTFKDENPWMGTGDARQGADTADFHGTPDCFQHSRRNVVAKVLGAERRQGSAQGFLACSVM